MATDLRVVIDTSTVVSAVLLPKSTSRRAFDLAIDSGNVLLSESTLAELDDVLRRPKFDKYVSLPKRMEFLLSLLDVAEVVEVTQRIVACRDPNDDKFLELAVAGNASHVVSGDADLRSLHPFRGIAVPTSSEFLSSAGS